MLCQAYRLVRQILRRKGRGTSDRDQGLLTAQEHFIVQHPAKLWLYAVLG